MVKAEVYASQHRILTLLDHKPMMSQKEIATVMEVSTATVAVTLKDVEKIMDDEDNRFNKIKVTERGKEMMRQGFEIMERIDQATVQGFTEEELKQFTGFMERYYKRLEEMVEVDYTVSKETGDSPDT